MKCPILATFYLAQSRLIFHMHSPQAFVQRCLQQSSSFITFMCCRMLEQLSEKQKDCATNLVRFLILADQRWFSQLLVQSISRSVGRMTEVYVPAAAAASSLDDCARLRTPRPGRAASAVSRRAPFLAVKEEATELQEPDPQPSLASH